MSSQNLAFTITGTAVLTYGSTIGGAFIASAVCPVLTPLSALALGVIFGTAYSGALISGKTITNPTLNKVALSAVPGLITFIGLCALTAVGIPVTYAAVAASMGFGIAILVAVMILSKVCYELSSGARASA